MKKTEITLARNTISEEFGFKKNLIVIDGGNSSKFGAINNVLFTVCGFSYQMNIEGDEVFLEFVELPYSTDESEEK